MQRISVELGKSLKSKAKLKGFTQAEIANHIGVEQSTVSRIFNGKTQLGHQHFLLLCDLLEISPHNMQVSDDVEEQKEGYRTIPEYNVRVSAGHGEFQGIEEVKQNLQMPKMFLPENGQVGFVRVEGDSMTPTIAHGDYVAVEFDSGYTSDGLYLIRIDDAVFVKRLQRKFGGVRIISDNQQYEEMNVSPDDGNDFGLIGRVALVIRNT